MEKIKKSIEFFANTGKGALEMKKTLEERGYEVNHVYTASTVPIIIDRDNRNFTAGIRNIVLMYGLPKINNFFR